ncbi:MAG: hypothetical protein K5920_00600 [Bacteroidales bacterium]|nr:hypothetical protein [Bacteroidales bacterium]
MNDKPNMRIECRTKRAFDNALAIINFFGSGGYRLNKTKRTIELIVSDWHYFQLIEFIHKQFSEELGERAWRKEIDFYMPRENMEDEKIQKDPKEDKPDEKRVLHLIFGESASRHADDFDELISAIGNYDGTYIIREFDTVKEEEAYLQALEDLDGWNGYATLESFHDEEEINGFDKRYEDMRKVQRYLSRDLYQVETDEDGVKWVHIDGFCYLNDGGDEAEYRCVQGTWCCVKVEDLMKDCESAERAFEATKQYEGTITVEEICEYYENAKDLPYSKVTQDTPDGWYIN